MDDEPAAADTATPPQTTATIPVRVEVIFTADGQQLGMVFVEGALPLPGEGQTARISIPLDARVFVRGLVEQLAAFDQAATQQALRERRLVVPLHATPLAPAPLRLARKSHD